ncbi:MAG TPA: hypothetical protein VD836_16955 [Solirubrobacteraceae bacterium]|nr:hypothetical protein [Solirubrobacteraceae bacterium]
MSSRSKAVAVVAAIAFGLSGGVAMAHDPNEFGERLTNPFGKNFWFFANFQTAQNPFNAANTHVTSSDIAFWGDLAYVGDYGGFRIFDVSTPVPTLVSDERCYGPQGDPSVFDTDDDGAADTLVLSVDSVLTGSECGAGPAGKDATTGQYPAGAWEGLRVFDISEPAAPEQIAAVYQDCGSHTNTLLPAPDGDSMYVLNSSYPLGDGPTCGPLGADEGRAVNHGVVQVIEVPFDDPAAAAELTELPVVYPGDADGVYRPVADHGISAPLDNFLGCHDLSSFPELGIVGAACGEQAQVWDIDEATGLPDTANPRWVHDQPNVDFWHSATFSWDGKVANFIDESFGDGCPTVTTKTAGLGEPREWKSGNMFFFDTESGDLLSEYRNPRRTNDDISPDGNRLTYCSSHLGIPVPAEDRYLLVNAYYRGGSSVIDFTDPTRPREIAFADMDGTNTWSAYTYPRSSGTEKTIPVYSNDGLSRNYGTGAAPDYREAAYGFQRFAAKVGPTDLVGLDRLNPQLQEQVIEVDAPRFKAPSAAEAARFVKGRPAPSGARNLSARPYTK